MPHPLSLSFLTTFDVGPLDAIAIAEQAGYDMIGLRLTPAGGEAPYPVMTDPAYQRATIAALRDSPVTMADVEIVRLGPDSDIAGFEPFCDLAARLQARHVLVAGDDDDHARITDSFAAFCDLAAQYDLTADLEFMPWTGVKTLAQAHRIVADADRPNGGVLIDALHFDRSGSSIDDIRSLPPRLINYAQLCDGPAIYDPSDAGLIQIARAERMLPGTGGIDLVAIVSALPDGTPISVEVPQHMLARTVPPLERARRAIAATREVLARAGRS